MEIRHPWEGKLPSPPRAADVVRSIVLQHVRWAESRQISAIHQAVLDDYGQITERTVYRHLAILIKSGEIMRVRDDSEDTFGYVRMRRPRWSRSEQVYV